MCKTYQTNWQEAALHRWSFGDMAAQTHTTDAGDADADVKLVTTLSLHVYLQVQYDCSSRCANRLG